MIFILPKRLETKQDLFKLAINSVFGKTIENVSNYSNVRFESNPNKVRRLVASPFYEDIEIIEETGPTSTGIVQIVTKQKTE